MLGQNPNDTFEETLLKNLRVCVQKAHDASRLYDLMYTKPKRPRTVLLVFMAKKIVQQLAPVVAAEEMEAMRKDVT